ncbi:methylated-DNA--[protein]-cysteine S-methyltransferase (plasmid) [Entomospira nematocerorum]|uniref:Methylated-DNA--protein-cysteine methyltransferase n=1 Tax=Entomospira nematocerorum TaxID=2719987 RepID=A0A968KTS2_9SPIO|nr:methylated-DNA--[protein]-cysteine S-methyltransferase [Entomospira nematocera]NIZ47671.1 methylated-DNA--[protein]-cysteine S-methyltransferase [Entomospira nematocera]WDI34563.1 methylated-DNA--[protein]-cysteine S-methyltransferase [Entomospira nematocera]
MAGYYQSPIGWWKIEAVGEALTWVGMVDSVSFQEQATTLEQETMQQLDAYFHGRLTVFDVPYSLGELSPFSHQIFQLLLDHVGYGQRITYGELANMANAPGASRAVGRAMSSNPITIIVPCHRVVGRHQIGGYAWSTSKKIWLLDHELQHLRAQR